MIKRLFLALLLCAAAPAVAANLATAAQAPNRFAATIVPTERFELGATLVERHGLRGAPLIFLPGLASGSWTWQAALRHFAGQHERRGAGEQPEDQQQAADHFQPAGHPE